ncbi:TetR/AcrR family transcriptional regulator [Streptomyces sp. P6-2-1]|uniref:TetR/AcrR family transcriptional regulator n=1 Tax=unclassified Streptomyces TaxID=2593676 RepID=UPI003D368DDB
MVKAAETTAHAPEKTAQAAADAPKKAVRAGSSPKRAAILAAARELFVRQGVDRVSMDALATRAGVSKRTVYDYFGDKRSLFLAILADASASLHDTMSGALDRHLPADAPPATLRHLEDALTALAVELGTSVVGSADFATAFGLVAQERLRNPATEDDLTTAAAEELLAERVARYTEAGLLETDDPRVAATHFYALTVLLAYERQPVPSQSDPEQVRAIMTQGAHAFIRAYGVR